MADHDKIRPRINTGFKWKELAAPHLIQCSGCLSSAVTVKALDAGADMLLMPEDFEAAYNAVLTAVKDGTIQESRIDESITILYRFHFVNKIFEIYKIQ